MSRPQLPWDQPDVCFVAIDFETADRGWDSACAVGLVRVEGDRAVERQYRLIRPPRPEVRHAWVHGLTWEMLREQPVFGAVWRDAEAMLAGAAFLAAHNAPFDRCVLRGSCEAAGVAVPDLPFLCTVRLARRVFRLRPATLPNVAAHLALPLQHHHALSDAEACAGIVLAARRAVRVE